MTSLLPLLIEKIKTAGPMSLEVYMHTCLMDPEHGYYTTHPPFGSGGDFVTAPEISQIFGELIAVWFGAIWRNMGEPNRVCMVELGPGRGTLMADFLRTARSIPGFFKALDLHLVETSPRLRAQQKDKLAPLSPYWHTDLETIPQDIPFFCVANEFFDALASQQWIFQGGQWRERVIITDGHKLAFGAGETYLPKAEVRPWMARALEGDICELSPLRLTYAQALAKRLAPKGGACLIVDYGHTVSGLGDTLQALKRHRFISPLCEPGACDLTTHVDFQSLSQAFQAPHTHVHAPMTQGEFLKKMGIKARLDALLSTPSLGEKQKQTLLSGVDRLVSPSQMGTLFKTLSVTSFP